MNKTMFNKLQKQGLAELKDSLLKTAWWKEGPRYTLHLHKGSIKNRTRVYMDSIKSIKVIPSFVYHEGVKYLLDYKTIEERDFPMHFIPFVSI